MTLQAVKSALLTVGVPVNHFTAIKKPDRYIVWAEDSGSGALWAGDRLEDAAVQGTIDYFTRTENEPNVQKIVSALNDAEIPCRLNSIQREDETGYIHYEWTFEVFVDGNNSV